MPARHLSHTDNNTHQRARSEGELKYLKKVAIFSVIGRHVCVAIRFPLFLTVSLTGVATANPKLVLFTIKANEGHTSHNKANAGLAKSVVHCEGYCEAENEGFLLQIIWHSNSQLITDSDDAKRRRGNRRRFCQLIAHLTP